MMATVDTTTAEATTNENRNHMHAFEVEPTASRNRIYSSQSLEAHSALHKCSVSVSSSLLVYNTRKHLQLDVIVLKRSCPAVSQICSLIVFASSSIVRIFCSAQNREAGAGAEQKVSKGARVNTRGRHCQYTTVYTMQGVVPCKR
jgi:hypothetical protein